VVVGGGALHRGDFGNGVCTMRQVATAQDGVGYAVYVDVNVEHEGAELVEDGVFLAKFSTMAEARAEADRRTVSRCATHSEYGPEDDRKPMVATWHVKNLEWRTE
jgi:hypothetical protein